MEPNFHYFHSFDGNTKLLIFQKKLNWNFQIESWYVRKSWDLMVAWNSPIVIEIGSELTIFSWYLMYFGILERKVKHDPIKCTIIQDAFYISGYHWISLDSWGMSYLLRYHILYVIYALINAVQKLNSKIKTTRPKLKILLNYIDMIL